MLAVVIREIEDESWYVGVSGAVFKVIEDDKRLRLS
jgi:phenylpyruvate tautomerase PptA (4-oxalocrotonate tautomerase family)